MPVKRFSFTRTSADPVTEELVLALSGGDSLAFADLFTKVNEALKRRNVTTGTEDALKLRCYNRLLTLAERGLVEKKARTFRALAGIAQGLGNGTPDVRRGKGDSALDAPDPRMTLPFEDRDPDTDAARAS